MKSEASPSEREESSFCDPRPPRVECSGQRVQVVVNGLVIADTTRPVRVLEPGRPPVYYLPPAAVRREFLRPSPHETFCEWKGIACYWDIVVGDRVARDAAWSYPRPAVRYAALTDFVAVYPSRVDCCTIDGIPVEIEDAVLDEGYAAPALDRT